MGVDPSASGRALQYLNKPCGSTFDKKMFKFSREAGKRQQHRRKSLRISARAIR